MLRARGVRRRFRRPLLLSRLLGTMLALLPHLTAAAQTAPSAAADLPTATLHVYVNLMQIPVLVLSPYLRMLPSIAPDRFRISLDHGQPFTPRNVRREGDDPIDLAILIDASQDLENLQPRLADAIATLGDGPLHSEDRVSVYAIDCALIRSAANLPPNPPALRTAVAMALHDKALHHERNRSSCAAAVPLWGAVATVASGMADAPSRRVLLVISSGFNITNGLTWQAARVYADNLGVSIFGLFAVPDNFYLDQVTRPPNDPFDALCQLTGGLVLPTHTFAVPRELRHLLTLIRSRYILSFPRPDILPAGAHNIAVDIDKLHAFIRPGGLSVPVASPSELATPTRIPANAPDDSKDNPTSPPP